MKVTAVVLCLTGMALGAPASLAKRQTPCFIVGSEALPKETTDLAASLAGSVTCSNGRTTIAGVPDVTAGGVSFSSINFAASNQSPLEFALERFATATPLASSDLARFRAELDVYLATEAGVRSVGGPLAIKVPKFFLQFQIARIEQAQGIVSNVPGMTVEHQLGKVVKNAGRDPLVARVQELATILQ